ncbi:MAG: NAD(P)-dependent oxidoreductase [Nitrososphaerales archaeon]|jgi:nucleoside-diphosphate-sugar epimerase
MKQRILVIGANSALAQDAIPVLAQNNTLVTAGKSGCDLYCDVTEVVHVPNSIDVVINFSATFGGSDDAEMMEAQQTNSTGTLNICMAANRASVSHVVLLSSLSAVIDKASPYHSIYAITKRHADELATFYCDLHTIPLTILRPSQIYGDADSFKEHQPLFYEIIDRAQNGEDISIYGAHDALRNYMHCADLSQVLKRVIEKRVEGIYPCAYPSDITYSQIARIAQKTFMKGGKVRFLKNKPNIPDNVFHFDSSLYERIGYQPRVSVEAGIRRVKRHREGVSK